MRASPPTSGPSADAITPFALRDGTAAWLFPLLPTDREDLVAEFERLSPESVRHRFLRPVIHLSEDMLRGLVDEVDGIDHIALVLAVEGDDELVPIAIGRIVRYAGNREDADIAVTVKDSWQGHGAGTLLLAELVKRRPAGVTRLVTEVAADNAASLAMLRGAGVTEERHAGDGILDVTVDLPEGTTGSGADAEAPPPLHRPVPQEDAESRARRQFLQTRDLLCPWFR